MDDASLEEFVDAESEDDRSESSKQPSDTGSDGDEADTADDPAGVAPAASTYAWTGDGAVCTTCGESVERRWRDGAELVCADCKEW